jgi:hypothetical protein
VIQYEELDGGTTYYTLLYQARLCDVFRGFTERERAQEEATKAGCQVVRCIKRMN